MEPRSHKKLILITVLVIALGSALAVFQYLRSSVEVFKPKRGRIVEAIYALGKVKSRRQFDLKIGVTSTVEKLYVREGDSVKKNDPLVKLSESNVFRAPFTGVVTYVGMDEGETATPSVSLLRVDDLSEKFVEVSLEQQGALRVNKGLKAEIVFESLRGEKLQGQVASLFSKNDEFLANIDVNGLKENVLPGMTADVAIIVGAHENSLLIPIRSINNGFVTIRRNGRRLKVPVKIGAVDSQMAEVVEGDLNETDEILVGGR